jgi:hypothetical protein
MIALAIWAAFVQESFDRLESYERDAGRKGETIQKKLAYMKKVLAFEKIFSYTMSYWYKKGLVPRKTFNRRKMKVVPQC